MAVRQQQELGALPCAQQQPKISSLPSANIGNGSVVLGNPSCGN